MSAFTHVGRDEFVSGLTAFRELQRRYELGSYRDVKFRRGSEGVTSVGHRPADIDPVLALDVTVTEYEKRNPEAVAKARQWATTTLNGG